MLSFHTNLSALKHPSVWAGIAGAVASVASSTTPPWQTGLLALSGFCSVMAIIIKSPDTVAIEEQSKEQ